MLEEKTPETTQETIVEQGTVGETEVHTPSKTDEPVVEPVQTDTTPQTTEEAPKPHPVSVDERINRMYARFDKTRVENVRLTKENKELKGDTTIDDEDEPSERVGMTEAEVSAMLDRRENDTLFRKSETRVFKEHPDAINEDGTFNKDSKFLAAYVKVGTDNPQLLTMTNGPDLAAAMVDKQLGTQFKQGRVAEAERTQTIASDTYTAANTITNRPAASADMTDQEKVIAKKMGIKDTDYDSNKPKGLVKQKDWS